MILNSTDHDSMEPALNPWHVAKAAPLGHYGTTKEHIFRYIFFFLSAQCHPSNLLAEVRKDVLFAAPLGPEEGHHWLQKFSKNPWNTVEAKGEAMELIQLLFQHELDVFLVSLFDWYQQVSILEIDGDHIQSFFLIKSFTVRITCTFYLEFVFHSLGVSSWPPDAEICPPWGLGRSGWQTT